MPAWRNAGRTEMRWPAPAGNHVTHARDEQNRRLQFALGVSFLLHALVYAHYRGASVESIHPDATGSRRAALHLSLPTTGGASLYDSPRFASPQALVAGDELAGTTVDGAGKSPADEPYYTRDMLNRPAQPISDIRLPPELLPLIPPQLLLELWIDKHGVVRRVLPIKPVQVSPAVLRSFDALRFTPASRNGLPVNSRKLIELAIDGP